MYIPHEPHPPLGSEEPPGPGCLMDSTLNFKVQGECTASCRFYLQNAEFDDAVSVLVKCIESSCVEEGIQARGHRLALPLLL